MKNKVITKSLILSAIKTEPLLANRFFHTGTDSDDGETYNVPSIKKFKRAKSTCPVCAVGSLICRTFDTKTQTVESLEQLAKSLVREAIITGGSEQYVNEQLNYHMHYGRYLSALSIKFERLMSSKCNRTVDGFMNAEGRKKLTNFVNKQFPSKIIVDTTSGKHY